MARSLTGIFKKRYWKLQSLFIAVGFVLLFVQCLSLSSAETASRLNSLSLPVFPLGVVSFPNGNAVNLTVNIGAGAYHAANDPAGRIWTITNRGPLVACGALKSIASMSESDLCDGNAEAKLAILPTFAPTIYALDVNSADNVQVSQTITLKGKSGKPIYGIFQRAVEEPAQPIFNIEGTKIEADASGIDPASLVKLVDGSFLISEQHGPSLLQVASDGTIIKRLVISGTEAEFEGADYDVVGALPAILKQNKSVAAFEAMSMSPDERFIFIILRGPLSATGGVTDGNSPYLRVFKLDSQSLQVLGQYTYTLDAPQKFATDYMHTPREQKDVRISEIISLTENRLLIVERISRVTHFFIVDLAGARALASVFDTEIASPILEAMSGLEFAASGIFSVKKNLIFDLGNSNDKTMTIKRIEGVARMSNKELIIISNNGFGIEGDRTKMFRLNFPEGNLK